MVMAKTAREIREKLLTSGAERLSDAELVALILREGTDTCSVLELAEKILSEASTATPGASSPRTAPGASPLTSRTPPAPRRNTLSALASADISRLRRLGGMGTLRASALVAAAEFGRRVEAEKANEKALEINTITSTEDVLHLFAPLADLVREEFWVLFLSSAGRVIDRLRVSQGGVGGTVVDHRLIVKRAVELLAPSLILVHNHPSGVAAPSPEDITTTDTVRTAAALFDIRVLDHVIVSRSGAYSFAENGI